MGRYTNADIAAIFKAALYYRIPGKRSGPAMLTLIQGIQAPAVLAEAFP